MKKAGKIFMITLYSLLASRLAMAQCSICSKTASQLGEEAGRGLNSGILYLAGAPLLIISYIGYRWWKDNRKTEQ
ncbi:MAG TPA: hypothetical protein PK339_13955 [Flavitalea sp.]|nr:hypothetical protein [Flavitalea sp.]